MNTAQTHVAPRLIGRGRFWEMRDPIIFQRFLHFFRATPMEDQPSLMWAVSSFIHNATLTCPQIVHRCSAVLEGHPGCMGFPLPMQLRGSSMSSTPTLQRSLPTALLGRCTQKTDQTINSFQTHFASRLIGRGRFWSLRDPPIIFQRFLAKFGRRATPTEIQPSFMWAVSSVIHNATLTPGSLQGFQPLVTADRPPLLCGARGPPWLPGLPSTYAA